jgi:hypothetical protein
MAADRVTVLPRQGAELLLVDGIALMVSVLQLGTTVPDPLLELARDMRSLAEEWGFDVDRMMQA